MRYVVINGVAPPISIHALRGEGDDACDENDLQAYIFLSTPSVGRATGRVCRRAHDQRISIHALRGEGDQQPWQRSPSTPQFLSTPSVGRATARVVTSFWFILFLSTPSVGRATRRGVEDAAPYEYFYPRPPWGGRPHYNILEVRPFDISIHALRGEGDLHDKDTYDAEDLFLSTPSVGRATGSVATV